MGFLRVRNLGKAYKRYARKSGRLAEWIGLGTQHQPMWVLRDVSFDVRAGEAVGIIGANGAGKSTLLKIITGTIRPTIGSYEAGGRIAALLELGIGFHPEFTGRQNVYMSGHVLGIPGETIATLMNEIEAFSEIGDYIDQPVRTYSSGMQVRLAFSVATAVRPDILIIDEALSVGDTYFQHKSFDRIRQFRDQGTTLLFVSHNASAIKTLCDRAILLDQGALLRDDEPEAVLDYYNAIISVQRANYEVQQSERTMGRRATRSGTGQASIAAVDLIVDGISVRAMRTGQAAMLSIAVVIDTAIPELTAGIMIRDRLGNDIFGTNTFHMGRSPTNLCAGDQLTIDFTFPALRLGLGSFSVTAALHEGASHIVSSYDWWDRALVFQVIADTGPLTIGVCDFPVAVDWRLATTPIERLEAHKT